MAYTFLRAQGHATGDSLVEAGSHRDRAHRAARAPRSSAWRCTAAGRSPRHDRARRQRARRGHASTIPAGKKGVDIGPASIALYKHRDRQGAHALLERPHGHLRGRRVQQGHDGDRRTRWPKAEPSPSSAAATRSRRSRARVGATTSPTSRPAAAPRSSSSRGVTLPVSRCSSNEEEHGTPALLAGNWKMHATRPETTALIDGITEARRSAAIATSSSPRPSPRSRPRRAPSSAPASASPRQNLHTEPKGAFTGRDRRRDVEGRRLRLRRSSATPSAASTSTRPTSWCAPEDRRRHARRPEGDRLHRRDAPRARGRQHAAGDRAPGARRPRRTLSREAVANLVIAYEPVWAIGTGKTATPEQAEEVHAVIRSLLQEFAGDNGADAVRILYGGSVKADNIDALMAQPNIDGASSAAPASTPPRSVASSRSNRSPR